MFVHSGSIDSGHYYAFIRTDLSGEWLKFDDERVTREGADKALDKQFGTGGRVQCSKGGMDSMALCTLIVGAFASW